MYIEEIFYGIFWISAISVIWFYTDWFLHYSQLFGVANKIRLSYQDFINKNQGLFFPDFLYVKSLSTDNRLKKFLCKLISCPFCILAWMSLIYGLLCGSVLISAPIYIGSLFIVLQIKKMI